MELKWKYEDRWFNSIRGLNRTFYGIEITPSKSLMNVIPLVLIVPFMELKFTTVLR